MLNQVAIDRRETAGLPSPLLLPVATKLRLRSHLSGAECGALLALPGRKAVIERGGCLVSPGKDTKNCCALLAGFASRQRIMDNGRRQILAIHMAGDVVDLQNAGLGMIDYSVHALTSVTVAYIPTTALLRLANEYPGIAGALWRYTLIDASITREWLSNLGRRDAHQRIAHLFCELAIQEGQADPGGDGQVSIPLTQEQIGEVTGLTAVHVNRMIQRMRREGFIRVGSKQMSIVDWPALMAAAGFSEEYLHHRVIENAS